MFHKYCNFSHTREFESSPLPCRNRKAIRRLCRGTYYGDCSRYRVMITGPCISLWANCICIKHGIRNPPHIQAAPDTNSFIMKRNVFKTASLHILSHRSFASFPAEKKATVLPELKQSPKPLFLQRVVVIKCKFYYYTPLSINGSS